MSSAATQIAGTGQSSSETASFLAELALHPAVQEGDLDTVANFVCAQCLNLIDVRFVTVWLRDQEGKYLRSLARFDAVTQALCENLEIPLEHVVD